MMRLQGRTTQQNINESTVPGRHPLCPGLSPSAPLGQCLTQRRGKPLVRNYKALDPKAWKAGTTSAEVVGPGDLIKEGAKGPEGRNIKNRNANTNHDAMTSPNNAAKHQ